MWTIKHDVKFEKCAKIYASTIFSLLNKYLLSTTTGSEVRYGYYLIVKSDIFVRNGRR